MFSVDAAIGAAGVFTAAPSLACDFAGNAATGAEIGTVAETEFGFGAAGFSAGLSPAAGFSSFGFR